jgi:hypothetical protein
MAATAAGKPSPLEASVELLRRENAALRDRVDALEDAALTLTHHSIRQNGQTPRLVEIVQRYSRDTGGVERRPAVAPERRVGGRGA